MFRTLLQCLVPADRCIGVIWPYRPQVLSLVALDVALDAWDGVQMDAVRSKSLALSELFIELVEARCAEFVSGGGAIIAGTSRFVT